MSPSASGFVVDCANTVAPICGSDGITYRNVCLMTTHACQHADPSLTKLYDGPCTKRPTF
jgi:hypothetical protein